ncbi:hypothetical protein [Antiquaquibacter soli]|uniref:Uncharacterized protein n=1 Tax=Antiquaquibacter soli TaxID=3064523 RepID=A0ABT9BR71_9MICO|nr:hypothetical protein [Protaetiibacter sp. WY-16]MDO7883521.1 hypothetical protein [Protaetiibacter sp. WY-16]
MKPDALIESYVADVVRHLPRRQRADVAFELRSLLADELEGRAGDAEPTAADALDLLAGFGRPADVADRYRPAGFTIIRPAEAPRFALIALIGVALQWIGTLPAVFVGEGDWLNRLAQWWLSWGLGAFWWPGILVSLSIVAALVGSRRDSTAEWTPREAAALDRDRISRPLYVLAIAGGLVGVAVLLAVVSLESVLPGLPRPLLDAFEFDAGFLSTRAPWALALWAASFAGLIAVLVAGRWSRGTRILAIAVDAGWLALLIWWATGPVFVSPLADSVTRGCLLLVAAFVVWDAVASARRLPRRIPAPAVP